MKKALFIACLLVFLLVFAREKKHGIDGIIATRKSGFLNMPQQLLFQELNEKCGLTRIQWGNEKHTQARYASNVIDEDVTFCDFPVVEVVFDFTDKLRLESCKISIYNRGDCGAWSMEQFKTTQQGLAASISKLLKKNQPIQSKRKLNGSNVQQLVWRTSSFDMALRWCMTDETTEYITIQIDERNKIQDLRDDIKTDVKAQELLRQVKKEVGGTRWIDVPMVDQGQKGYCVVAVLERMMKYYNSSIDQHIIAQLMASDPSHGTDIQSGIAALKSSEHKLKIRIKELYANKAFQTVQEFENMLGDYNKAAKKAGQQKIDLQGARNGGMHLVSVLGKVEKETYIRMRQKERPGPERFFITVKDSIDRGVPLMWMVLILPGELREQPMASLHARLINGYNPYTKEIIYTDSWGSGHEKKSMKLEEAWAISNIILNIRPL
jgi:hypothetical protein